MKYTGERVIPSHDGKPAQGGYDIHELMYREFLVATEGKRVIDIACGCGHGTKLIAEKADKVFGYDIDPEAIQFASAHNSCENASYFVSDIKSIPHKDEDADVIISVETFEHVTEIEKVISEVHRVLVPNGIWCFTTPNGVRYPDHNIVPWHIKHYNRQELHNLLDEKFNIHVRETGFEPDSSLYLKWPTFGNYSIFCIKK